MAVHYEVCAIVVDIRADSLCPTDRFLVDTNTNAWAWRCYPNCCVTPTGQSVPQGLEYPYYMRAALRTGAILYRTEMCLAELLHVVEKTEHEAYMAGLGPLPLKDYRHNLAPERPRVVGEQRKAWSQVKADGILLELPLNDAVSDAMMTRSDTEPVDGYDLYTLEVMNTHGVTNLISDDGDFCTVAGITLFTANPRVIAAARAKGLLVVR